MTQVFPKIRLGNPNFGKDIAVERDEVLRLFDTSLIKSDFRRRSNIKEWAKRRLFFRKQLANGTSDYNATPNAEKKGILLEPQLDFDTFTFQPNNTPYVQNIQMMARVDPNHKLVPENQHVHDNKKLIRLIEKNAAGELIDRTMKDKGNPTDVHVADAAHFTDPRLSAEDITRQRLILQSKSDNFIAHSDADLRNLSVEELKQMARELEISIEGINDASHLIDLISNHRRLKPEPEDKQRADDPNLSLEERNQIAGREIRNIWKSLVNNPSAYDRFIADKQGHFIDDTLGQKQLRSVMRFYAQLREVTLKIERSSGKIHIRELDSFEKLIDAVSRNVKHINHSELQGDRIAIQLIDDELKADIRARKSFEIFDEDKDDVELQPEVPPEPEDVKTQVPDDDDPEFSGTIIPIFRPS